MPRTYITYHPQNSAEGAVRAFKRRLQSTSSKVLQLTLTQIETCVKNCNQNFHAMIGSPEFLDHIARFADGHKVSRVFMLPKIAPHIRLLIKKYATGDRSAN